jgi:predicted methyltransferase
MSHAFHARRLLPGAAACLALVSLVERTTADNASQTVRLVAILELRPGMTVADVGAGRGDMTVLMAPHVGPTGRVYSTDIVDERLADIRSAVSRAHLQNVVVVKGAEGAANLPDDCCDAIFIRDVYHHFPDPSSMNRSLLASLKPGGRLAVIDFVPEAGSKLPNGAPPSRGGHGVLPAQVIEEVTAAGFSHTASIQDWDEGMFLLLFRKAPGN